VLALVRGEIIAVSAVVIANSADST